MCVGNRGRDERKENECIMLIYSGGSYKIGGDEHLLADFIFLSICIDFILLFPEYNTLIA